VPRATRRQGQPPRHRQVRRPDGEQHIKRHSVRDLFQVIWPLLAVIICLLVIGALSLRFLTAARAYVSGEGFWSKAQKEAIIHLDHYASTGDDADYQKYRAAVEVTLGDKAARLALEQSPPDLDAAHAGFLQGRNAAADIPALIDMYRYFRNYSRFVDAIDAWREGDAYIAELMGLASDLRQGFAERSHSDASIAAVRARIRTINERLTPLEDRFSMQISEASREMRTLVSVVGLVVALLLVAAGVFVSQRMLSRVTFFAQFDPLTRLPNRHQFQHTLRQAIVRARRSERITAVLFIDIDGFKAVNDTLGHGAGDQVLIEMARRLQSSMRESDTVARLGGDEFVVIVEGLARSEDVQAVARKIIALCTPPFVLRDRELFITASIGVALYPADGDDAASLLMHADTAMYRAKASARNEVRFYSAEMGRAINERFGLEMQLRHAVDHGEFEIYFQPIVDLYSGERVSMEALLRWQHPEWGLVTPQRFMALAEQSGLIVPIGRWVLEQACSNARAWQQAQLPPIPVALNLSARQFKESDLAVTICGALERHGLDGRHLHVEITESVVMEDLEGARQQLQTLRDFGIRVSLDDFGVGHSSMSYLKHFPLDDVKIDQAFVRDIASDDKDTAIVRAIIELAHTLNLTVTAEGVESADQLRSLREMGCDKAQGYWLGVPIPAAQAAALLSRIVAAVTPVQTPLPMNTVAAGDSEPPPAQRSA